MKTGRYRVRKGWFGKCILQAEYDAPMFLCGKVDSSVRDIYWKDVPYTKAPTELKKA